MSRRRTYYDVLGVAPTASTAELRRVHRDLVRRFHPDTVDAADAAARAEAAGRIREVNEAWKQLSDPVRRARYDRTLEPEPTAASDAAPGSRRPYSPYPPGTEPEPPNGFDEWFADADLRRSRARVVDRTPRPVKPFRARVLFGFGLLVLVGILVIVMIAGGSPDGPGTGISSGQCVRVDEVGPPTQVPCELPNDGRVLRQVSVAGKCPNGAMARQLTPGDTRVTCLEP